MSIILAVNDLVEHYSIEHTVGIYIGLLLLACLVAIAAKLISHLPYTIFLTIIGLVIGIFQFGPKIEDTGFGHGLIFLFFCRRCCFRVRFTWIWTAC